MHTQAATTPATPATPATTSKLSFWDLDDLARGFISTALQDARGDSDSASEFFAAEAEADRTEGRVAGTIPACADESDIPADEIARVVAFLAPLRERMAAEIAEASSRSGYDLESFGSDLYMTIVGHGVGFWSRETLEDDSSEYEELTGTIRRHAAAGSEPNDSKWQAAFDARALLPSVSLGDRLSALCGRGEICLYPDGDAESYVLRFDCLYTSGAAS